MSDVDDLTLGEVLEVVERLYPPSTAQSWDRVGLVTGDPQQPVRRVHLAVDPTLAVIEEARALGADLLLTHHPLLLRGVHSVATTSAKGAGVTHLVVGDVALYVAHTNADVAADGVCEALAQACGLTTTAPLTLVEDQPLGRVGDLEHRSRPAHLRRAAGDPAARGRRRHPRRRSTGCRRCGASPCSAAPATTCSTRCGPAAPTSTSPPTCATTRPSRPARRPAAAPPYLVDAGHWASEQVWLAVAERALRAALGERATRVETHISTVRTDPWTFVVGADPGGMP